MRDVIGGLQFVRQGELDSKKDRRANGDPLPFHRMIAVGVFVAGRL